MLSFLLGLLCGAILVGLLGQLYLQRRTEGLREELAHIRARLRSFSRLTEAGFLEPSSVEAASVLNDLHDFASAEGGPPSADRDEATGETQQPQEADRSLPPIFRR